MMASFDSELVSKSYVRLAKFSGGTKAWPRWKKGSYSYYSQIGCGCLFTTVPGIPNKLLTAAERAKMAIDMGSEKDEAKKLVMKQHLQYCQLSDKAHGHLVQAIDTSTD
jgi:hypothetical protein